MRGRAWNGCAGALRAAAAGCGGGGHQRGHQRLRHHNPGRQHRVRKPAGRCTPPPRPHTPARALLPAMRGPPVCLGPSGTRCFLCAHAPKQAATTAPSGPSWWASSAVRCCSWPSSPPSSWLPGGGATGRCVRVAACLLPRARMHAPSPTSHAGRTLWHGIRRPLSDVRAMRAGAGQEQDEPLGHPVRWGGSQRGACGRIHGQLPGQDQGMARHPSVTAACMPCTLTGAHLC